MRKSYILLFGLLCCCLNAYADDLASQIARFIKKEKFNEQAVEVKVEIRTPNTRWPSCSQPQFSLPSSTQHGGNLSISARCGAERRFIQTQVQLSGRYLVAARPVRAGSRLTDADVTYKSGRLDTLPSQVLSEASKATGAVSLRDIPAGRPLTTTMLRRSWVVKANQEVQVKTRGTGFSISSVGKAMNNAAITESVRVRMASGQIVNGIAEGDGSVRLSL